MTQFNVDDIKIGTDSIDALYIGSTKVFPLVELGSASLKTSTFISTIPNKFVQTTISLSSSSSVLATGTVNGIRYGSATLSTDVIIHTSSAEFEMFVTSTVEPSVNGTAPLEIIELSTGYWRVACYQPITYINFDYFDLNMRETVTAITVTNGKTLTNLYQSFYLLQALETFIWLGPCNVTNMYSTFAYDSNLTTITLFDTSKVTTFEHCWNNCTSLTTIPAFNTSSAINFRYAWANCNQLQNFPSIDTTKVTDFSFTWSSCTNIKSIGYMNTTAGTNFNGTFANCSSLICLSALNTTNATNTLNLFIGCASLSSPDITEQTLLLNGYTYINPNPCPLVASIPPIYYMQEPLYTDGVYWFVVNSSPSGSQFNGRLEEVGTGSIWHPSSTAYGENGIIDLTNGGTGHYQINTQWIPPASSEWQATGIYNVVLGVTEQDSSYDIYTIHYNGNNTADIYTGSYNNGVETPISLLEAGVPYTPPTTPWIITENAPEIVYAGNIVYNMDDFYISNGTNGILYNMDDFYTI